MIIQCNNKFNLNKNWDNNKINQIQIRVNNSQYSKW